MYTSNFNHLHQASCVLPNTSLPLQQPSNHCFSIHFEYQPSSSLRSLFWWEEKLVRQRKQLEFLSRIHSTGKFIHSQGHLHYGADLLDLQNAGPKTLPKTKQQASWESGGPITGSESKILSVDERNMSLVS